MSILIEELPDLELNRKSSVPLHQQLYEQIKRHITHGKICKNSRLPASRNLAAQLKISRNTAQKSYEQLRVEGYLEGKAGSGIYVKAEIPENYFCINKRTKKNKITKQETVPLDQTYGDFTPGIPDLSTFPHKLWSRLCHKALREQYHSLLFSKDSCGNAALKQAIIEHLNYTRGVNCQAEQVIITTGAQEGINLVMRVLLNNQRSIAIENPGYPSAYDAAKSCHAKIIPTLIEKDGIDINSLKKKKSNLIYLTPSHQYPLGTTLPITKRLALIELANKTNRYIIEDDYDSEFHYQVKPLPCMQGLDRYQRVIYLGTFSKVLFPAIRLGFIIVPKALVKSFKAMKQYGFGQTPLFNQAVLAEFINEGHFSRHIKRMRLIYSEKHRTIVEACKQHLPPSVKLHANNTGLHVTLSFENVKNDLAIANELQEKKFFPAPLSRYYFGNQQEQGLVIGFANTSIKRIKTGIKTITELVSSI